MSWYGWDTGTSIGSWDNGYYYRPSGMGPSLDKQLEDFISRQKEINKQNLPKGVEMKGLFEVIGVYGEDRDNVNVFCKEQVVAADAEDAKVKSGIYSKIDSKWDADYLTIIVRSLGEVRVKERPKEVKNV